MSEPNQSFSETAAAFIKTAKSHDLTIATVESCSAGALAAALAQVPGAGEVLHGGFVTYSKAQKIALGVPSKLLAEETAVSMAVAEAMARNALDHTPADMAIAITGVAGPEPDEDGNPVGQIFVASARRCGGVLASGHCFDGDHAAICTSAMHAALEVAEALMGTPRDNCSLKEEEDAASSDRPVDRGPGSRRGRSSAIRSPR